uniref:Uncharacterized protein n=1 Tax=Klebsiella pneumoniae TaxID=573 RepID=A0A8B0SW35_KLEPN|nr:hypothetical protein [Klebsiella pneumoniae]
MSLRCFFLVTSLKYPPENAPHRSKKKTMQSKQIKTNLVKARFKNSEKRRLSFYSLKMGFLSVHLPASLI